MSATVHLGKKDLPGMEKMRSAQRLRVFLPLLRIRRHRCKLLMTRELRTPSLAMLLFPSKVVGVAHLAKRGKSGAQWSGLSLSGEGAG